jgi:hypothetical protein
MENNNSNTVSNKQIYDLLNKNEQSYLSDLANKLGNKFYTNKREQLKQLIQALDKPELTIEDFKNIRKQSISKGGFFINNIRKEIYKKALNINTDHVKLIYYSSNCFEEAIREDHDIPEPKTNYDYIIEVDVKRSILNTLLDRNKYDGEIEFVKKDLIVAIKKYTNLADNKYHYFQGFHDIGLYMNLLFLNYEGMQLQSLQRLSEFYFKDYLIKMDLENMNKCNFRFEVIYSIVNDIVKALDWKLFKYIQENTEIHDPLYSLAWVLTFFTHDLRDMFKTYRLFDYLLFAEPGAIFHIAANVFFFNFRLLYIMEIF